MEKLKLKMSLVSGFTLIELIVVIAIIAILAAVVAPNAFLAVEKAKVSEAISDFKTFKTAIYALYSDTGRWVTDNNPNVYLFLSDPNLALYNNPGRWNNWDGPYLDKVKGRHPWRGSYAICGPCYNLSARPRDMTLEFEDTCFPNGPNTACPIPFRSAQRIDSLVDDGNLSAGEFYGSGTDYHWVLGKDIFP